jgi:hypothetical protein
MGTQMVQDQLHQLTDWGNPPIAQDGGIFNVANMISGAFTTPGKGGAPASGGLGDTIGNIFGGKGGAKGIMDASQNMFKDGFSSGLKQLGTSGGLATAGKAAGLGVLNAAPQILEGIGQMKQQKTAIDKANQASQISGLNAQAAALKPEKIKNQYNRPEDALVQPGQLGNPMGTGTNFLAQNGAEIQNTYNPGDLYNDLGYEPLNDSNPKQYQKGGKLISREKFNVDSYGNQGVGYRDIFQNPNMTQDTAYSYEGPNAMLKYETNSGKPFAYVGGRGGFTSAQPDSLAKYKQLLSSPFSKNVDESISGMQKLAKGKYQYGGDLPEAEFGDYFQSSGQASIGKGIGSAVGSIFGPLGSQVGGFLGSVAGNLLGGADDANKLARYNSQNQKNIEQTAFSQGAQSLHSQNASYMAYGGSVDSEHKWVSNGWQPQVIATFGEHKLKDLLKPPHDADMLRAGGHLKEYTPPSARALFTGKQMAMGGDLKVLDGGYAEPISYNPYMPGTGETVMFRGRSHDDGGIPIQYGQNGVEVEGGEPMFQMEDGGPVSNTSGVVAGNMKIDKFAAQHIEDPKAEGKKYKNYIADLSKVENKQNKLIDKSTQLALDADANSVFDQLSLNSAQANIMGANMKLKQTAMKKMNAAAVQNAILDTAKELGVKSDKLAEGKFEKEKDSRMAKFGAKMETAQNGRPLPGIKAPLFGRMLGIQDRPAYYNPDIQNQLMNVGVPNQAPEVTPFTRENLLAQGFKEGVGKAIATAEPPVKGSNKVTSKGTSKAKGKGQEYIPPTAVNLTDNRQNNYDWTNPKPLPNVSSKIISNYDQYGNYFDESGNLVDQSGNLPGEFKENKFDWKGLGESVLSNAAPLFRPTNQQALDPSQLYPEMFALGANQLEPVRAQQFQPMLQNQPSKISLQDQINTVDSQANAAIRAAGQNPAAQAQIMAQAIDAKNRIKGEEFRMNQQAADQTYTQNRQVLNDAQLRNLQLLDQQYVRQAEAKSKTKAQAIEALKSIATKTAQNKLENKQLGIYENLYNYRFGPKGQAYNVNAPAQFNIPEGIGVDNLSELDKAKIKDYYEKIVSRDKTGNVTGSKEKSSTSKTSRNGSIVKALKTL